MTLKEEEILSQWLDEQLKAGLIVESNSRYAAPCFFIPKKDGTCKGTPRRAPVTLQYSRAGILSRSNE